VSYPCTGAVVDPGSYPAAIQQWVDQSAYVIRASVLSVNAGQPALTVHVTQFLYPSDVIGGDAMIYRESFPSHADGDEAFFFGAYGIGDGFLLRELAELSTTTYPGTPAAVSQLVQFYSDHPTYHRLVSAYGTIDATVLSDVALSSNGPTASEHDPLWHVATVQVNRTLCGTEPATIEVRWSASNDIAWYNSPKLAVGQQSIFILHGDTCDFQSDGRVSVTNSLDVQPVANWDSLSSTLQSTALHL
jgi:hypothetical protein